MFPSIQNLMMYSICLVFVVGVAYAGQLLDDVLETFTIVEGSEALDILQNEYFRSIVSDVVKDVLENESAAFFVVKSLLFSSSGKGLARKSGYVDIHNWHRD